MLSFRTFFRLPILSRDARVSSRGLSVSSSTSLFRTAHARCYATSALAEKLASSDQPRDPNDARDLPSSSANEREVFIQWDGTSRSKLSSPHMASRPLQMLRVFPLYHEAEIPPDLEPVSTRSTVDGLQVVWPASTEPHVSIYPWSWLRQSSYSNSEKPQLTEKVLWGSKIAKDPPSVSYSEVMSPDGLGLYKWLSKIDKFGFCFVSGLPATPEATEELSNRIGFIRETHYGKFWDFTADLARGDTAYTNLALPAHTDNTYFTDPCGVQLLHLLEHTDGTGGATLLVDGFYVASILRDLYPEAYSLLSTVPIAAHAAGEAGILYRATHPLLEHDAASNLQAVRWNNDDRSALRGVPYSDIPRLYEAMRTWNKLITSQDSEYWVQLSPGTAVAINNHRVLHGRSAFTGKRRMCGAYIGADEFHSRIAVLSEKFASQGNAKATGGTGERGVWSDEF